MELHLCGLGVGSVLRPVLNSATDLRLVYHFVESWSGAVRKSRIRRGRRIAHFALPALQLPVVMRAGIALQSMPMLRPRRTAPRRGDGTNDAHCPA
ncbi:MAG TPA: hypothetical protein VGK20_09205 [Candidatus Binatia bacterium]